MRNASRILLLIGGIISIVSPLAYLIFAILFFIAGNPEYKGDIIKALQNGTIHSTLPGTVEEQAEAIQVVAMVLAIVFLVLAIFCIANAIIAFVGRAKETKGLFIMNIVFGALSGVVVNLVGGILGVIYTSKKEAPKELN